MKFVTTGATLKCNHGGTVDLSSCGQEAISIGGKNAVTAQGIMNAKISGCGQTAPGTKPCACITSVMAGLHPATRSGGEILLDQNVVLLTDGLPPGLVTCSDPGNTLFGINPAGGGASERQSSAASAPTEAVASAAAEEEEKQSDTYNGKPAMPSSAVSWRLMSHLPSLGLFHRFGEFPPHPLLRRAAGPEVLNGLAKPGAQQAAGAEKIEVLQKVSRDNADNLRILLTAEWPAHDDEIGGLIKSLADFYADQDESGSAAGCVDVVSELFGLLAPEQLPHPVTCRQLLRLLIQPGGQIERVQCCVRRWPRQNVDRRNSDGKWAEQEHYAYLEVVQYAVKVGELTAQIPLQLIYLPIVQGRSSQRTTAQPEMQWFEPSEGTYLSWRQSDQIFLDPRSPAKWFLSSAAAETLAPDSGLPQLLKPLASGYLKPENVLYLAALPEKVAPLVERAERQAGQFPLRRWEVFPSAGTGPKPICPHITGDFPQSNALLANSDVRISRENVASLRGQFGITEAAEAWKPRDPSFSLLGCVPWIQSGPNSALELLRYARCGLPQNCADFAVPGGALTALLLPGTALISEERLVCREPFWWEPEERPLFHFWRVIGLRCGIGAKQDLTLPLAWFRLPVWPWNPISRGPAAAADPEGTVAKRKELPLAEVAGLTGQDLQEIKDHIYIWEQPKLHAYVDYTWHITVGVGHNVGKVTDEATRQKFLALPFIRPGTEEPASEQDKINEYLRFVKWSNDEFKKKQAALEKKAPPGEKGKTKPRQSGWSAELFTKKPSESPISQLRLKDDYVKKLYDVDFKRHADDAPKFAGKDKFDRLPINVRKALIDIVYNMGLPKALIHARGKFIAAVKARDWAKAAELSFRTDVQPDRNAQVRKWFMSAADDSPPPTPGRGPSSTPTVSSDTIAAEARKRASETVYQDIDGANFVFQVFGSANLPYPFRNYHQFAELAGSHFTRIKAAGDRPQCGDVMLFNEHMGIWDSRTGQLLQNKAADNSNCRRLGVEPPWGTDPGKDYLSFSIEIYRRNGVQTAVNSAAVLAPPLTLARQIRAAALSVALGEHIAGAREIGGNNQGSWVRKYLNNLAQEGSDWCASFVSWCFRETGFAMMFSYAPLALDIRNEFRRKEEKRRRPYGGQGDRWFYAPEDSYEPVPGDLIVWKRGDPTSPWGHIGIVFAFRNGWLYTIEGNRTNKVQLFRHKRAEMKRLLGFCHIPDDVGPDSSSSG